MDVADQAPTTAADDGPPWHRDPILWSALGMGLLLRGGFLALHPHSMLAGDEGMHYVSGVLTSYFGPWILGHWAPGYEVFLATVFFATGPEPWNALALQVVLSTCTIATVYGIARAAGGLGAGRFAAAISAVYPSFVAYSILFYGETLFLFLLTASICALYGGRTTPSAGRLAAAGLLLGLSILTRSLVVWCLPIFALWLALRGHYADARRVGLVLGIAILTVLPWTLRNWAKYDGFLLVDGTLGRTLYLAYSQDETDLRYGRDLGYMGGSREHNRTRAPQPTRDMPGLDTLPPTQRLAREFPEVAWSVLMPPREPDKPLFRLMQKIEKVRERATIDLIYRQAQELSPAAKYARSRPGRVARQTRDRLYAFWGPNSFLLRSVHDDRYPSSPLSASNYPVTKWIVVAANVFVVGLALLAAGRRRPAIQVQWGMAFAVVLSVMHALSEGNSRYRLPLMPFLIVMAAVWLASPHWPEGRGRRAVVGMTGIAFAIFCGHYVATVLP